jgi:hypothetical protein
MMGFCHVTFVYFYKLKKARSSVLDVISEDGHFVMNAQTTIHVTNTQNE